MPPNVVVLTIDCTLEGRFGNLFNIIFLLLASLKLLRHNLSDTFQPYIVSVKC